MFFPLRFGIEQFQPLPNDRRQKNKLGAPGIGWADAAPDIALVHGVNEFNLLRRHLHLISQLATRTLADRRARPRRCRCGADPKRPLRRRSKAARSPTLEIHAATPILPQDVDF
jgi:hypothetical protein